MKKKYKILLVVIAALALLLGASYAYWLMTLTQSGTNVVTTSCFELTFDEVTGSDINLTQAYPMTEEEGQRLTPYQFTIKNICDYIADYNVTLETMNTSTLDTNYLRVKLNNNNSFILGNITPNETKTIDDADNSRTITTGTLVKNEEVSYDLRLWIDNDSTIAQSTNKSYSGKIVVIGAVNRNNHVITLNLNGATSDQNRILTNTGDTLGTLPTIDRFGYIFDGWYSDSEFTNAVTEETIVTNELTNIYAKFTEKTATLDTGENINIMWKTLAKGSAVDNCYDIDETITSMQRSETLDNTDNVISMNDSTYPVYTWYDNGTIYWYSEANKFYLNENSEKMFYYLKKVENIDLSSFDSSNVTNMSYMFSYLGESTSSGIDLDLSSFDSSNVKYLDYIIQDSGVKKINISDWNFSNYEGYFGPLYDFFGDKSYKFLEEIIARNMTITSTSLYYAFRTYTSPTKKIDISGINMVNGITSMTKMFMGNKKLTEIIGLNDLDVTNTTSMNQMFQELESIEELDISEWNIANASNIQFMFQKCPNLKTIYVNPEKWNTDGATNSSDMFYNDISLVGGAGTTFDSNHVDKEYARVDGGPDSDTPGYLTDIADKPTN